MCSCKGRRSVTPRQLGRVIGEDHRTILRLHHCKATARSAARVLDKLLVHEFLPGAFVDTACEVQARGRPRRRPRR